LRNPLTEQLAAGGIRAVRPMKRSIRSRTPRQEASSTAPSSCARANCPSNSTALKPGSL